MAEEGKPHKVTKKLFNPWADGNARRIDEGKTIVATQVLRADWADWYVADVHVDEEGQFMTTTFRKHESKEHKS